MQIFRSLVLYHAYSTFQFGLFEDQTMIAQDEVVGNQSCVSFLPQLEELFQKHNVALSDINFCTVYSGPGSFTALRVALSFANGFAFARQIPLVDITGFQALATQLNTVVKTRYLFQAFKAFGEELYLQIRDPESNILIETCTTSKNAQELLKLVPSTAPCYFVGNGIPLLLEHLGSSFARNHPENILDLTPSPSLQAIARCGLEKFYEQKKQGAFVYNAQPTYIKNPPTHTS